MTKADLKSLDNKALEKEVVNLKKELFNLKLNASTMHVKDFSQFKKLRRNIAQVLTYLRGREDGR
ncbi:50S ribosomal protein L29 [Candidatus Babeliales bacterium]|nr:50S ribosomal protein L29 [Candidatus Babeliales bacterium]